MPDVAAVLREEMQRLISREVNARLAPLQKHRAEDRRAIAALRREVLHLKQTVAFLETRERRRLKGASKERKGEGLRFSPKWLKADRKRLGLSLKEFSRLVGVSPQTIGRWESGEGRPRAAALARLSNARAMGKREARKRLELLEE